MHDFDMIESMINEKCAKRYCSDDISLIENYHQAIADKEKMWDIHHRRECDDEGRTLFTQKQLKKMNLYYKRPASELMFVTRSMHWKIHREMREQQWKKRCSIGGKIGGKISGKKNSISILQFSKDGKFIKEWPSITEAQHQLGIMHQNICDCCKGKRNQAGGFIWRYKDPR